MKITVLMVLNCTEGTDPVILASATDLSHFWFFQRQAVKEFIVFFSRLVAQRTNPSSRQTIQQKGYKVHSYNRNGLCSLVYMDDDYPVPSAFLLLNQVLDEYHKDFGDTWRAVQADRSEPWSYLNEALTQFQDPAEVQNLFRIHTEFDERRSILLNIVASILTRDENWIV